MSVKGIYKPSELLKAKYVRRWKGKDGKWRYDYYRAPKERKPPVADTETQAAYTAIEDVIDTAFSQGINTSENAEWMRETIKRVGSDAAIKAVSHYFQVQSYLGKELGISSKTRATKHARKVVNAIKAGRPVPGYKKAGSMMEFE